MEKHLYFPIAQNHCLEEEEVTERSLRAAGKQTKNKKTPKRVSLCSF